MPLINQIEPTIGPQGRERNRIEVVFPTWNGFACKSPLTWIICRRNPETLKTDQLELCEAGHTAYHQPALKTLGA